MRCTGAAVDVATDEECAPDDRGLMVARLVVVGLLVAGLLVVGLLVPDGPAVSVIEVGI